MRKILLLSVSLLLLGVGGATSVKAEKTYWSPSSPWSIFANCKWTPATNTFSWDGTNNTVRAIQTGFPEDLSAYTAFYATVSDFKGEGVDHLYLKVNCTGGGEKIVNLSKGKNAIYLSDLFANPAAVTTFELWGPKSTDTDCSAVLTDVYIASGAFCEVLSYMELPIEGCTFSDITITTCTTSSVGDLLLDINPFDNSSSAWEKLVVEFAEAPGGDFLFMKAPYDYYSGGKWQTIDKDALTYELDLATQPTDSPAGGWNRIVIQAGNGDAYPRTTKIKRVYFSKGSGLSEVTEDVDDLHATSYKATTGKEATASGEKAFEITDVDVADYDDLVLTFSSPTVGTWTVTYDETSENIPAGSTSYSVDVSALSTISTLTLSVGAGDFPRFNNFDKVSLQYKDFIREADDDIFALSKATGYNKETGVMTNGTWTFATPVDISDWDYLMITTVNNAADASHEITITDNNGVSVHGEGYTAETGGKMWLDRWNNQNAIRISLAYLHDIKSIDLTTIKTLKINGTTKIANVYLTNFNNTKINGGYLDGDVKREYDATGKFGTICLPYVASYAGCEVYSIASASGSGISLTKVTGLLEAGKPYFYVSADEVGKNNEGTIRNVNFFRADLSNFDAASAGTNNGLIGTFSEITAPDGANYLILSNNKLYNTEGATGDDAVIVGANKAYIDKTAISDLGVAVKAFISFGDDATKINAVENEQLSLGDAEIYNLAGQRMSKLQRGINIVNGKKVLVK